jgi:hypothetical protein
MNYLFFLFLLLFLLLLFIFLKLIAFLLLFKNSAKSIDFSRQFLRYNLQVALSCYSPKRTQMI